MFSLNLFSNLYNCSYFLKGGSTGTFLKHTWCVNDDVVGGDIHVLIF